MVSGYLNEIKQFVKRISKIYHYIEESIMNVRVERVLVDEEGFGEGVGLRFKERICAG